MRSANISSVDFRITRTLLERVRRDLARPHAFAAERVGVLYARFDADRDRRGRVRGPLRILAVTYEPVEDDAYIDDPRFGAVIGSEAFRRILQHLYLTPVGAFHVHAHPGCGIPRPSRPDLSETARFVPDFFHGRADVPHGAVILSDDAMSGRVWLTESATPRAIDEFRIVGAPYECLRTSETPSLAAERLQ